MPSFRSILIAASIYYTIIATLAEGKLYSKEKQEKKRARAESSPFRGGKEKGRNPPSPSFGEAKPESGKRMEGERIAAALTRAVRARDTRPPIEKPTNPPLSSPFYFSMAGVLTVFLSSLSRDRESAYSRSRPERRVTKVGLPDRRESSPHGAELTAHPIKNRQTE